LNCNFSTWNKSRMTEIITQNIAVETGEILRTRGRNETSYPISLDRIFSFVEFGAERIPLTANDIPEIKRLLNSNVEIAHVALRGFKPISLIPIANILEKPYFCYPSNNAIKSSTKAFANL
jgi:Ku70/Ku80 beta-barrel domain